MFEGCLSCQLQLIEPRLKTYEFVPTNPPFDALRLSEHRGIGPNDELPEAAIGTTVFRFRDSPGEHG